MLQKLKQTIEFIKHWLFI